MKRLVLAAAVLVASLRAEASVLYASGLQASVDPNPGLFQVDLDNPKYISIGVHSPQSWPVYFPELASDWRQSSFSFFGTSTNGSGSIVQFSPAGVVIKTTPITGAPEVFGTSLAFDTITEKLYAFGGGSLHNLAIYRVDPQTGATDTIGTITASKPTASVSISGAAFDTNGVLWGTGSETIGGTETFKLFRVDINTLSVSSVAETTPCGPPVEVTTDIAFRPEDNVLFGTSYAYGLYTIDPATGVESASILKPGIGGLAFGPVPEPNICCVSILLLLRRKRR
jgi:hypothetical protein